MAIRTDLAVEAVEFAGENLPQGVVQQVKEHGSIKITRVEVKDDAAARSIGKPAGIYTTVEVASFEHTVQNLSEEVEAIAEEIRALLPQQGPVLVVGLGNNDITPDAIGPKTVSQTLATRHIPAEVAAESGLGSLRAAAALAPGVLGQTGIETSEVVASLVKQISPAAVIVIDALASKSIERLGKTVQISNTGIAPGAGVQNRRKEISQQLLGVPVIAVGVPTVVDMATITQELSGSQPLSPGGETMMVTPRDIDVIVEKSAKTLSMAINKALQPGLSVNDLTALVS